MSARHLKKGDDFPPYKKDTLRIYSMRYCPFSQRTRLVLAHKKIPHEEVNVQLKEKPDWFLEKTPVGTTPVLEFNGKILWESAVCNDYLDEVYPNDQLNPKDPYQRARQRILFERWGKYVSSFYSFLRNRREEDKQEIEKNLRIFENELKDKYFAGASVGMIDFNMWPHIERPHALQVDGKEPPVADFTAKFPRLAAWIDRMLEEPAVKATYTDPETQRKYMASSLAGKPRYDDL